MENEKIKRIAESLGFETRLAWGEVVEILVSCDDGGMEDWQIFNPYENDADAFKALKHLLEQDCYPDFIIEPDGRIYYSVFNGDILSGFAPDFKTAICEAYLTARGKT